jgi:hypothetical protein
MKIAGLGENSSAVWHRTDESFHLQWTIANNRQDRGTQDFASRICDTIVAW